MYDPERSKNKYGLPELHGSSKVPAEVIGFNYAKTTENYGAGLHFFIDDYQFERLWNEPEKYIELLKKFDCVFTPDFSLYMDMPLAMKIWNIYRSRLIGQIMENHGIEVIPTLSWAGDDTLDFVFDGLPIGGTYAVSTVGIVKNDFAKEAWTKGMEKALAVLKPDTIVLYGTPVDMDWGNTNVVNFKARTFNNV